MENGKSKTMLIWFGIIVLSFVVFYFISGSSEGAKQVSVSELFGLIEKKEVKEVVFSGGNINVTKTDGTRLVCYANDREDLLKELRQHGVKFSEVPPPSDGSQWMTILKIGVLVLIFWFFIRMQRNQRDQAQSFTASKAKIADKPTVKFTDVAGCDEATEELSDIVSYLKDPSYFSKLGGRAPKGVILVGPPGTGKTLLARALAGEAGVPFFSVSGSDFVEMFVGVGASRVRDLFENGRKNAPCVIFIDEIDGLARQRDGAGSGGHAEHEQTLNQLMVEMDGFTPNSGIILIAATNRPDALDPALLRSGRFERKIVVEAPDVKGRLAILKIHAKNKPLDESVDLEKIAKDTYSMTGADLEYMLDAAARIAAKAKKVRIDQDDIRKAALRVAFGEERKSLVLPHHIKVITANHEAGHAIAGWFTPDHDKTSKITIIPRGKGLGMTISRPEEERLLLNRSQLKAIIVSGYGGRVAEELTSRQVNDRPDITTGASGDLQMVTSLARAMVCEYAMDDELGARTFGARNMRSLYEYGPASLGRDFSEDAARRIDEAVERLLTQCKDECRMVIETHRPEFDRLVAALLEKETLDDEEIEAILGPRPAKA